MLIQFRYLSLNPLNVFKTTGLAPGLVVTVSHRKEDHRHVVHLISRQTAEGGAEPNSIVFLASDTQTSNVPVMIWVLKEDSRGGQWSCLHREAAESQVSQSETPVHDSAWMATVPFVWQSCDPSIRDGAFICVPTKMNPSQYCVLR